MSVSPSAPRFQDRPFDAIAPSRRMLAGIVLALSNFMVVLDLTIANVSVPHISGDVGASLDQGTWIITSYAVAEAICVPLTGWLAQRFGAVRVFLLSMLGFGLFSLLCGMSQSLGMLVICRVGQGLCGGPIMPMSQTLMLRVFPPHKQPMAMAMWAMTVMLAPAVGPIFGGIISDNLTWNWIFLINVPIAAAISFAGYLLLRPVETETRRLPIDRVGLVLLILWIGCLQVMLDIGREHDWFADSEIVALGIAALVGFCVFVIWELTEEHPIVDLRVFRHGGFSATLLTQALGFGAFFCSVVVVPQWLQVAMGYSATQAGLLTALQAFAAVLVAPIVARNLPRVDPRAMISLGTAWMGLATLARMRWNSDADMVSLAWPIFAQGIGMPMLMIPLTSMALSSVDPEETASGAGLQNFVRAMAVAVGTSLVLTVWDNASTTSRDGLVGRLHPDAGLSALAGLGVNHEGARAFMSSLVDKEAITSGLDHSFLVSAIILFMASAIVWLVPWHRPAAGSVSPGGESASANLVSMHG